MAKMAGADKGGGPGTSVSGGVKSTMSNPLGKKVAKRAGAKRGGKR